MSPPTRRRRSRSRGRGGLPSLPLDALHEILLRLTAKELCRLRAVCRPWRALLSDPHFVDAHAARHPGPLIVAGYGVRSGFPDGDILCDIMDLSGHVVKRIRATGEIGRVSVVSAQLDLVQLETGLSSTCRLLDPATGVVSALPEQLADEHAAHQLDTPDYHWYTFVFGKISTTGEYKVLRVFDKTPFIPSEQLCEIFTLGASGDARWRAKKAPSDHVDVCSDTRRAVVNGIVYFFLKEIIARQDVQPKRIASFDLGTEEWGTTVQGPGVKFMENAFSSPLDNLLSLAAMNDCLAMVHFMRSFSIDLWYLMDSEKGLWVKQHSFKIQPHFQGDDLDVCPILVLNDGRIVTYTVAMGFLEIYNPRTGAYTTPLADFRPYATIGLYTGNLLSLANGVI